MQIDGLPIPEKSSKINNPCSQEVIEWKVYLVSKGFVRMPKPEPPVDTQKTHDF